LENGEIYNQADLVISAADGYNTIFNLLEGKYLNNKLKKLYSDHPVHPSSVIISLGIARTFENEPCLVDLFLQTPLYIDDQTTLEKIPITIYNFDPTLAPNGKTCIRVIIDTNGYQYWQNLKISDNSRYNQEKNRIAQTIIEILDHRFGQIKENVETMDVATPATLYRYTKSWHGSSQGWEWLPGLIPESFKKQLPGLQQFYLIGQWVMPGGGIPAGLMTGRDITRILCHKDHKKFQTTL
jgi:phytoene dehydrogenase-like protein